MGSHEKIKLAWREARDLCQPTQAALGWDWCLSKLKQYTDESAAQRFMDRKPVPYVSRGRGAEDKTMYILDHHHTLCACTCMRGHAIAASQPPTECHPGARG